MPTFRGKSSIIFLNYSTKYVILHPLCFLDETKKR